MFESKTSAALSAQAQLHQDMCFGGPGYLLHAARLVQRQSIPMCHSMAHTKNALGIETNVPGQINKLIIK